MNKRTFRTWIDEHKKELIAGGVGIVVLTLCVILQRDIQFNGTQAPSSSDEKDDDKLLCTITPLSCADVHEGHGDESSPYTVSEHIRNLPSGWHASPEKKLSALDHGYVLGPEQTWVESYRKGVS